MTIKICWPIAAISAERPDNYFPTPGKTTARVATRHAAQELVASWQDGHDSLELVELPYWREPFASFSLNGPASLPDSARFGVRIKFAENTHSVAPEMVRAAWAGVRDLAPRVLYTNSVSGGAITSDLGRRLSAPEANSQPYLNQALQLVSRLHRMSSDSLGEVELGPPNFLESIQLADYLHKNAWPASYRTEITQLEAVLETALQKRQSEFEKALLQGNFAFYNTLTTNQGLRFNAWQNLQYGDVATDFAHFACWNDISVTEVERLLQHSAPSDADAARCLLERVQLHLSRYHLKRHVFASAVALRAAVSPYAGWRLKQDLESIEPLLRDVGF